MVAVGAGAGSSTDWSELRQGAVHPGFRAWCPSWHCSVVSRGCGPWGHSTFKSQELKHNGGQGVWLQPYSSLRFGYGVFVMLNRPKALFLSDLTLTRT